MKRKSSPPALFSLFALALWTAGCGAPGHGRLEPPPPPPPPPPAAAPPAAPPQVQLEPPPPERKLAPLPTASKRVLVLVTERVGQAESARRDTESEAILAERLLEAGGDPALEVVKRGVYEEILERDFESLVEKGLQGNAQVLSNLLKAGVDYLALGEMGASERVRDIGGGRTLSDRSNVHAGVELVRTDDAAVLAVGNADAEDASLRDAKTRALSEAARKLVESFRASPRGPAFRPVTLTVDGLRSFEDADRIGRKLREIEGVVWSREPRFSAGAAGAATGVARFEIGWAGPAEDLRSRLSRLDAGVRLETTRIDGNRWNYHVAGEAGSSPPPPPPAPRPAPAEPEKKQSP